MSLSMKKTIVHCVVSLLIILPCAFFTTWLRSFTDAFFIGIVSGAIANVAVARVKEHPFNADMKGWDWVLHTILTFLFKYRDIVKDEDGKKTLYLRRFYIWSRGNKGDGYKGALFLHNIRRSDADRDLHDHPWDFTSLILSGGYLEELPQANHPQFGSVGQWHHASPGTRVINPAEHAHKVHLLNAPNGEPIHAWTLVKVGAARRVWGFLTENGWVDFETYLNGNTRTSGAPIYGEDVIPKK